MTVVRREDDRRASSPGVRPDADAEDGRRGGGGGGGGGGGRGGEEAADAGTRPQAHPTLLRGSERRVRNRSVWAVRSRSRNSPIHQLLFFLC